MSPFFISWLSYHPDKFQWNDGFLQVSFWLAMIYDHGAPSSLTEFARFDVISLWSWLSLWMSQGKMISATSIKEFPQVFPAFFPVEFSNLRQPASWKDLKIPWQWTYKPIAFNKHEQVTPLNLRFSIHNICTLYMYGITTMKSKHFPSEKITHPTEIPTGSFIIPTNPHFCWP